MAKTISTTKANPIRPFYAAVGGVDIAVALARTGLSDVQTRLAKVELEPKALVGQVQAEARTVPARVEARINDLVAELNDTVDDLNKQYVDLALRGKNLVGRIRRQQATQDLKAETRKTATKVKTTRTQAKKATSTVKSSAKATGTATRKTTAAAKKATVAAAEKTGTTGV
jgi:heparin binding hemagglutinin HbhA